MLDAACVVEGWMTLHGAKRYTDQRWRMDHISQLCFRP